MQKDLFSNNIQTKAVNNKTLVIQAVQKQPLNKHQQDFNRLVKKIESLREMTKKVTTILDDKLAYYTKHLHPIEVEKSRLTKENSRQLYYFFDNKKSISKRDREILREVIADMISTLLPADIDDDEMRHIFEEVNEMSYEDAKGED